MNNLTDNVKQMLPLSDDIFDEIRTPIQEVLEKFDAIDSKKINTAGGLEGSYSGSDIIAFFGNEIPNVLDIELAKDFMTVRFLLGPSSSTLALSKEWIDFNFIGLNEFGQGGLITGRCKTDHFTIKTGTNKLNIEIEIIFQSEIEEIVGWINGSYQDNLAVRDKLNELYKRIQRSKGIIDGKSEV